MEAKASQLSALRNRIFLTGFMGAGKSTVAQCLGDQLNLPWVDTDELIEKKMGRQVDEIFKFQGELAFRNQETQVLKEIKDSPWIIVALGGGTLVRPENQKEVHALGCVVYLQASCSVLWQRIVAQKDGRIRPLVQKGSEFFKKLYEQREATFCASDLTICTEGKTPEQVAQWITQQVMKEKRHATSSG
jgi:shikimate kinase